MAIRRRSVLQACLKHPVYDRGTSPWAASKNIRP